MRRRVPATIPRSKQVASALCCVPTCVAIAEAGPLCAAHRTWVGPASRPHRRKKPPAHLPLFESTERQRLNARLIHVLTDYAGQRTLSLLNQGSTRRKTNG